MVSPRSQQEGVVIASDELPLDLLEALVRTTDHLEQLIRNGKLERVSDDLKRREKILQQLQQRLQNCGQRSRLPEQDRKQWKEILTGILSRNEDILKTISADLVKTQNNLDLIRKGRRTLGLYRRPDLGRPKIFSCRG